MDKRGTESFMNYGSLNFANGNRNSRRQSSRKANIGRIDLSISRNRAAPKAQQRIRRAPRGAGRRRECGAANQATSAGRSLWSEYASNNDARNTHSGKVKRVPEACGIFLSANSTAPSKQPVELSDLMETARPDYIGPAPYIGVSSW